MEATKLEPLFNLQELEAKLNGNGRARANGLTGWDILSVDQFDRDKLAYIFGRAEEMREMVERVHGVDLLKGRVLACLFYEPSTR
ncbi:MAG: hypothetical protein H6663_10040, partial [Candidatus Promineofilum sp.]|nr:hypothetical protein [Promineifilum sp.]